jgi:hypothetical protein
VQLIVLKSVVIADDGLCCQVEAEIGGIVLSKLLLILQLVSGHLLHLQVLQVVFPSSVILSVVSVVVARIAFVSVVHI